MAKYKGSMGEIEAVKITAADYIHPDCWPDGSPFSEMTNWLYEAYDNKTIVAGCPFDTDYATWDIHTPRGLLRMGPDDYIIRKSDGELWAMVGRIFEEYYTLVEEGEKE